MANQSSRISQLKEMLELEEQRASLLTEIAQLDQRIASLGGSVFGKRSGESYSEVAKTAPAADASAPAPRRRGRPPGKANASKAAKPAKQAKASGRQRRGGLKDKIMSALESAGREGISVREVADALGTQPQNIYSWFNNTGRKNPNITKVGQAKYRLEGGSSAAGSGASASIDAPAAPKRRGRKPKGASDSSAKVGASKKEKKTAAPKKEKKAAAPKKEKAGARGGSARGELREKILGELKSAGSKGVSVKELAEKLDVNYKNISIWFSTTGRKHSEIQKMGPARYKIA